MGKKYKSQESPYSGFVLTFEPERTHWLAERLYLNPEFKESFSALDWEFERKELVLLVLNRDPSSISAFALMERMHGSGGSGKLKMRMTQMVVFDEAITHTQLRTTELDSIVCTPETLKRTQADIWNNLISELKHLRPEVAASIDALISSRNIERRLFGESIRIIRLNEQRDGLGLCLDIAQLDRPGVLKSTKVGEVERANSILDLLDVIPIQERSLLEHDRRIFEILLGENSSQSALFEDNSGRSVRVHVVDKTNLETVLGIDLIIYNSCYDSFVLLQYKRMEKLAEGWAYKVHPSSDLHTQLTSMAAFHSAASTTPVALPTLWSFRLNRNPFYFKFCEQIRPDARDEGLIPGITLCESHLREFLTVPEAAGSKGGLSIGYHNCPRYFNNTEFVQLAKVGWIGAGPQATSLLKKVLEENRNSGRSAMLAVIDVPQIKSASSRARKK